MSREPNFTPGPSERTLTIAAPPQPPLQPPQVTARSPMGHATAAYLAGTISERVYTTLVGLIGEVGYMADHDQLSRIDDADEVRERGEQLAPGSAVARIRRKSARMLRPRQASQP